MKNPEEYKSHSSIYVEDKDWDNYCFDVIGFFPELTGKKWDNTSLSMVSTLEPKAIRVTTGRCTCDSYIGRVTVFIDKDDTIIKIEKECPRWLSKEEIEERGANINMTTIKIPIDKVRSKANFEYFIFVDIEVENIKQILKIFMNMTEEKPNKDLVLNLNPATGLAFILNDGRIIEMPTYIAVDYARTISKEELNQLTKILQPFIDLSIGK